MASIFLGQRSECISSDDPYEQEDQVYGSVYPGQAKAKYKPSRATFHDQVKKTQEVFDDLKRSVIASTKDFENSLAQLSATGERLIKLSAKISSIDFDSAIKLDVGGSILQTSLVTGLAPVLSNLNSDAAEILHEAEYCGLAGLVKAIENKLNGNDNASIENVKEECETALSALIDEARREACENGKKVNSILHSLDANIKVLQETARHHEEMSMKLSNVHLGENVKIDVGGRIFKTSLKTLRREPESFLALMFSDKLPLKKEDDGTFFIDRDGTFLHHILNYLRDGIISEDVIKDYGSQIQREAEFYGLSGLKEQIHSYSHVKLNVGGRDFVVTREVLKQYPESMFERMLSGKVCPFKKRQDGSFHIQRDATNFDHILTYIRSGTLSDDVIEKHGALLLDDAEFYMLACLRERINNYYSVKMLVGGREFVVPREVLMKFPLSLVGKMLKGEEGKYVKRNDGSYVIQRDATNFNHILTYLRSRTLSDDVIEKHGALLLDDAEFYMLPDLIQRINNVKIIIGGKEFAVSSGVLSKFPQSLFGKMTKGEPGTYVKRSDGSYVIQRKARNFNHILTYLRFGVLSDDVIKNNGALLLDDSGFYMLPGLREHVNNYLNVKMMIGGEEFVVRRDVLSEFPNSIFGKMLKGEEGDYVNGNDGSYVIDGDAANFNHILTYLRYWTLSDAVIEENGAFLIDDADFYMLPELRAYINNYHNVKMIIGEREFVVHRKVLIKFQDSLFEKMLKGERGNYIKRADGSYAIDRDAATFNHILTYLKSGTLNDDVIEKHGALLLDDSDFFMLPCLTAYINNYQKVHMIDN